MRIVQAIDFRHSRRSDRTDSIARRCSPEKSLGRHSGQRRNQQKHQRIAYGIIGALCVVVAGGGFYMFKMDKPVDAPIQAAKPTPPAAPPLPVATPRPPPASPPAPTGPSANQINQARNLITDARRFASLGSFADAETALQNADKAAPGFAEVAQARRDISEMRTTRGQLEPLIDRVRRAIERGDFVTAERMLNEAEKIDANAPAVIEARRELRAAERRGDRPQDTG